MSGKNLDWERVARAEIHPLRLKLLQAICAASKPASPTQLAAAFKEPLGNVSYHVGKLAEGGLIELSHTEPRRGAVEHFYAMASSKEQGNE
jgi:DNA-binding transcriptional ArsR family regulator